MGLYSSILDLAQSVAGMGINSSGVVVGWTQATDLGPTSSFTWNSSSGFQPLISYPGAADTTAYGINDAGVIVGSFQDSLGGVHGFVDNAGTFTQIDVPGAGSTVITGINGNGDITGYYTTGSGLSYETHGFIEKAGGGPGGLSGIFQTFDGAGVPITEGWGINDSDTMSAVTNPSLFIAAPSAYITDGTNFTNIDVPGASTTGAGGIDNAGDVVGGFTSDTGTHGFLRTDETPTSPPPSSAPEPESALLVGAGVVGLVILRRRLQ